MSTTLDEAILRVATSLMFTLASVSVFTYVRWGDPGGSRPVFYYLLVIVSLTAVWRWMLAWAAFEPQKELDTWGWPVWNWYEWRTYLSAIDSLLLGLAIALVPMARMRKRCRDKRLDDDASRLG